jgi:deoxyribodipyrimidine photo-lyase
MYHISRPFESQKSCSRLSPYITYGCLSLKYVCKETIQRISELRENDSLAAKNHIKSLSNFLSRLHWQSHFIQKLEDEPEIEKRNLNPDFNRIRIETDQKLIDAVFSAQSGIPYIDAIMKELYITGWTNFRSRATLVSFLCNTCMQPWQSFAERLACLFTDYEPGIHYSQLQMQAATT